MLIWLVCLHHTGMRVVNKSSREPPFGVPGSARQFDDLRQLESRRCHRAGASIAAINPRNR